jgi:short-subunit dehydrogenase involved in D-alanine esterification of teichoic acids
MPLDQFIAEVMEIWKTQPGVTEICVEKGKGLRFAAESGHYDQVFGGFNAAMAKSAGRE